jgi:hypothetical protein
MNSSIIFFLCIGVASFLLCRMKAWLVLFFLPLNFYLAYELMTGLYGPSIYDSLLADFGLKIVVYCWGVATALVLLPVSGMALNLRARKHN